MHAGSCMCVSINVAVSDFPPFPSVKLHIIAIFTINACISPSFCPSNTLRIMWPVDPVVMWPCGHVTGWPFGHVAGWLCGHVTLRSCDPGVGAYLQWCRLLAIQNSESQLKQWEAMWSGTHRVTCTHTHTHTNTYHKECTLKIDYCLVSMKRCVCVCVYLCTG